MGYSLSWAAVKAKPEALYDTLGLRPTGELDDVPTHGFCAATLPDERTVIIVDHKEFKDDQLAAFSNLGDTVYCFVEEHVMTSGAAFWKGGKQIWRVTHEAEKGHNDLSVVGDAPPEFAPIRDRQARKSETGEADYIFDVPIELAKALTGFRHDEDVPGGADLPFEVLEPAKDAKKKKWWSLS
jgi:hypothetical protein